MVTLIAGPSHTGKTALAQTLLERYRYPVLSLDLLKMGLIRSGQTELTPEDDDALVPYLWGIAAETIKTAIENGQNLIVEGCYIPFDWQSSFEARYLESIAYCCLVMSQDYLARHRADIRRFANIAESRLYDDIDFDELARDNERALAACRSKGLPFCLIDGEYRVAEWEVAPLSESGTKEAAVLFLETVHAVNSRDYAPLADQRMGAWGRGVAAGDKREARGRAHRRRARMRDPHRVRQPGRRRRRRHALRPQRPTAPRRRATRSARARSRCRRGRRKPDRRRRLPHRAAVLRAHGLFHRARADRRATRGRAEKLPDGEAALSGVTKRVANATKGHASCRIHNAERLNRM